MTESIHMPEAAELREELQTAHNDIQEAIKEDPDLAGQSKFLLEVLKIIQDKIAADKDLNSLDKKEQISIIAHLNLFYSLLDDLFGEDFEDFDDESFEFEDDEDLEEETEK